MDSARTILAGLMQPGFLVAGAVLAAIPIIIHLLNRRRHRVVRWAAMQFLLEAVRKNRRRLRLEHWALLLTRCAILGLLGLALARPTGCDRSALSGLGTAGGLHVLVIDNSHSMGYRPASGASNLDRAKERALRILDGLAGGSEAAMVFTCADPVSAPVSAPGFDLPSIREAVRAIPQTNCASDLPGALRRVAEAIRGSTAFPSVRLHILSDSTRGVFPDERLAEVQSLISELGPDAKVVYHNLAQPAQSNRAVTDLKPATPLVRARFDTEFRAKVVGYGSATASRLRWFLDGREHATIPVPELSAEPQSLTSGQISITRGGYHVITAGLVEQDELPSDDLRALVSECTEQLRVLIVEGQRGLNPLEGSGAFLSLALAPPSSAQENGIARSASYVAPEVISDLELGNRSLSSYRAVVLAGVGQLHPAIADALRTYVERGGTLMLFMGDAVSSEQYNAVLQPRGLLPGPLIRRKTVSSDQRGFGFDFRARGVHHPYLQVFTGEENSGLDTAQVFTYWQVVPADGVERILDFLPGADQPGAPTTSPAESSLDPAFTVHSVGAGRVVFCATSANADWTSFPAKPAYVTLMHELLSMSVAGGDEWLNVPAGRPLRIPSRLATGGNITVLDSKQETFPVEPVTDGSAAAATRPLLHAGIYNVRIGDTEIPASVHVPPSETDLRPLAEPEIRRFLGPAAVFEPETGLAVEQSDSNRTEFGWILLVGVMLLLCGESFMASRFGRAGGEST
jgi:hypothetical protein